MSNKEIRKDQNKPIFFGQIPKDTKVNVKDTIIMKIYAHSSHNWDSFGAGTAYNLVSATVGPIDEITEENGFVVLSTKDGIILCKNEEEKGVYYGMIFEDAKPKTATKVIGTYTDTYCYNDVPRIYVKDFVPDQVSSEYADRGMYVIRLCDLTFCCVRVYTVLF